MCGFCVLVSKANEHGHIDTSIIKFLDGTKVYPHAVIDNVSRKILAWRAVDRFEIASTIIILTDAVLQAADPDHTRAV